LSNVLQNGSSSIKKATPLKKLEPELFLKESKPYQTVPKALFGKAPAPCKKGRAGAGGAGFCGSTGSTSSQAKPQLYLFICYSMKPLHFLSIW